MERLGVDSQETIAFEDSLNGVRAAKRADIYCVAVPNAVTANMDFSESNLQLGSLLSLSPQELIKIVEAN
jgi:putative hydrolase of the HAD superfamily